MIDEHGRTCSTCGEYKAWSEYYKSSKSKTGHKATCKTCEAENKTGNWDRRCKICGGYIEKEHARLCNLCRSDAIRKSRGVWFIVKEDPTGTGVYRGGWHSKIYFDETLIIGHWPEGMIVERRENKKYTGTFRVEGHELEEQRLVQIGCI